MREILFRGQCCTDGKWVEGYLGIEVPDELVIQQFSYDEYFKSNCIDQYSVKPETVGQYTGLKDLHGTRIFEGDVVKYKIIVLNHFGKMEYKETKSVVEYNAPCFSPFETDLYEDYVMPEEAEVIGNIYDNPELLEGENNVIS